MYIITPKPVKNGGLLFQHVLNLMASVYKNATSKLIVKVENNVPSIMQLCLKSKALHLLLPSTTQNYGMNKCQIFIRCNSICQ